MYKRTLKMAGVLGLVALLAGCSLFAKDPEALPDDPSTQTKPEHAPILLLEGIREADFDRIETALVYPSEMITPEMSAELEAAADNALARTAIKTLFKPLEYEIIDVSLEGEDIATVTLEVTYPDLSPIITSNFKAFAPKVKTQLATGTLDKAALQNEIIWAVAADLIAGKATGTLTETIVVTCSLVDGKWKALPDMPILNVCTGNALNAMSTLDYTLLID